MTMTKVSTWGKGLHRKTDDAAHLNLVAAQCEVEHKEKDGWARNRHAEGVLHCNMLWKELSGKQRLAYLRIVLRELVALAAARTGECPRMRFHVCT